MGIALTGAERDLFERLIGRAPNAQEEAREFPDTGALLAYLTDLDEYRNRFRDAEASDANALAAARLWPADRRDYDLQILVISGEGLSKCRDTIDRILGEPRPRTLVTLLCGDVEDGTRLEGPGVEHVIVPGASVFELRALVPTILKEASWVALMEDHAVPHAGWVAGVLDAIRDAKPDQVAFTGTVTNQVSTSTWSWASFLFNFAYHWYPSEAAELPGTVTSLVFRRDIVGRRPFPIHYFEQFVLGRRGPAYATIKVDHAQPMHWWEASYHTFDNGLVTGSALRRHRTSPRRSMLGMIRWVNRGRVREISALLTRHPDRTALPPGTVMRLRWIGICHSAGVVLGTIFGGGRAHKRLE